MQTVDLYPYRNPDHPGNKTRADVKCLGCGKMGCVTLWGDWCFECNVKRMDRINASLEKAFPKRCLTGDGDPQNMECRWCGAPLGGVCQDITKQP